MDSIFTKVSLTEGLGDCIILAGVLEQYSKLINSPITFHTSDLLIPFFEDNPYINPVSTKDSSFLDIKWVSQLNNPQVYNLHTAHRFSIQLGFYSDPSYTPSLYQDGKLLQNNKSLKSICINSLSKEYNRRFIPREHIQFIRDYVKPKGYTISFIGNNYPELHSSNASILESLYNILNCKLFIGPVSFWYHFAESINATSILYTGYMPGYRFSHFKNTHYLESDRNCRHICEREERNGIRNQIGCHSLCFASEEIKKEDLYHTLDKLLIS